MCEWEREIGEATPQKWKQKKTEFILLGRLSLKLINNRHNSCLHLCGLEERAFWALVGEQSSKKPQINYT